MVSKKSLIIVLTLVLTVASLAGMSAGAVQAAPPQQDTGTRTITVTGFGTAYGAPDIVMVGLGVEAVNADIKAAMDETTARMNAVMAVLQENGVAREDIRTEYFSIYQDYGYGAPGPDAQAERAYRVSTSVAVTVRSTDSVSELLAAAVDAGANIVNYIQFDIESRTALQSEARTLAVDDARARADHLAGLLGMRVGETLEVVEGSDAYGPVMGVGGGGGMGYAEAGPPISQGQLRVNMSVTITFALVPAS